MEIYLYIFEIETRRYNNSTGNSSILFVFTLVIKLSKNYFSIEYYLQLNERALEFSFN